MLEQGIGDSEYHFVYRLIGKYTFKSKRKVKVEVKP